MLVQLKDLLLFDNGITVLPNELGTLYQVENLGLEGNPLQEPLKGMLQKEGSQAVIGYLRDCCPGGCGGRPGFGVVGVECFFLRKKIYPQNSL